VRIVGDHGGHFGTRKAEDGEDDVWPRGGVEVRELLGGLEGLRWCETVVGTPGEVGGLEGGVEIQLNYIKFY
jgi:hypothetical protein